MSAPSPRPPRNERLDRLLAETADALAPAEAKLVAAAPDDTRFPLVLVVGPPRSGTTLLTQWLAASGAFFVPTNLLARFSLAPAVGARVQAILTDPRFAFGDELFDLAARGTGGFESAIGKTRGALAPNEFAFFWRRFLRTSEIAPLGADGVARADWDGLRRTVASMESVAERPVAMKGMFVQYDLAHVARLLPHAFFLRVRRDPVANALALLAARERYHGDRRVWYSARPAGAETLRDAPPEDQVAGQVVLTERAIDAGLAAAGAGRSLELGYESFCADPRAAWASLRAALRGFPGAPCDPGPGDGLPERFDDTSRARAASPEAPAVAAAVARASAG